MQQQGASYESRDEAIRRGHDGEDEEDHGCGHGAAGAAHQQHEAAHGEGEDVEVLDGGFGPVECFSIRELEEEPAGGQEQGQAKTDILKIRKEHLPEHCTKQQYRQVTDEAECCEIDVSQPFVLKGEDGVRQHQLVLIVLGGERIQGAGGE